MRHAFTALGNSTRGLLYRGARAPANRRSGGFTLVELLVVVSIIVVLIALLLPALDQAREHAKRLKCLAQLRGLAFAQGSYSSDNRGHLAPHAQWDVSTIFSRSFGGWADAVDNWTGNGLLIYRGYVDNPRTAWCPYNTAWGLAFDHPTHGWREDPQTQGDRWMAQSYQQRTGVRRMGQAGASGGSALVSDGFTRYGNGAASHHLVGYNVAYLDGSGQFLLDKDGEIASLSVAGGKGSGAFIAQEAVYIEYFDR